MSDLLLLAVLTSVSGVVVPCVFWIMHAALARRVARLEAQQHSLMSHADSIRIFERLAGLDSKVETLTASVISIKKFLQEQGHERK